MSSTDRVTTVQQVFYGGLKFGNFKAQQDADGLRRLNFVAQEILSNDKYHI